MRSEAHALIEQLDTPSFSKRREVVRRLAELGDRALPPLLASIADRNSGETRLAATVEALVLSHGDVESALRPLAMHENAAVVADVAQILGRRRSADSIEVLVRLMDHESDNVAVTAIEALGRIGGRSAATHLLRVLERKEFFRVFPAIDVLGRTGDPRAVEPLAALLEHPHYALEAIRALGRSGQPAAILPLSHLLTSENVLFVRLAAVALEELQRRCFEQFGARGRCESDLQQAMRGKEYIVRPLASALEGAEPAEQAAIARLLGEIGGEEALDELLAMMRGPSEAAEAGARALAAISPLPVEALDRAIRESSSRSRSLLLSRIDQAELAPAVTAVLSDPDEQVRLAAIGALYRMGRPQACASIFPMLQDESGLVRQAALSALLAMGGRDLETLAMQGARSESTLVRRASLRILGHFGFADAEAALMAALADPDPQCRDIALQGLALFGSSSAIAAIVERATARDRDARASAVRAMGTLPADSAREALWRALKDEDEWVRYCACRSIGKLRDEASWPVVLPMLSDPSRLVRIAAIEAIAHFGGDEASRILAEKTESKDEDVQRAGLIGLGILGGERAYLAIERHLSAEDPATRLLALSSLEKIRTPRSLSRVLAMLDDPDARVGNAAFHALADWPGREASAALLSLMIGHPDEDRFVEALARPIEGRTEVVLAALFDADDETAPLLTAALARNRSLQAAAALEDVLIRGSPAARKTAASALIAMGGRAQQNAVRDALALEKDREVRRFMNALLSRRA